MSKSKRQGFQKYQGVIPVFTFDHLLSALIKIGGGQMKDKSDYMAKSLWNANVDIRYVPKRSFRVPPREYMERLTESHVILRSALSKRMSEIIILIVCVREYS